MPRHDSRAAFHPKCRSQRGSARVASKLDPTDPEAAAGSVQREDDDVTVEGVGELVCAVPPQ